MQRLKFLLSLLFLAALSLDLATAQPGPGGRLTPEERRARFKAMAEELDLTEEQQTQLQTHRQTMQQQLKDLRAQELPRQEMRLERKALRETHHEAIRAIMSEEQYARFLELRKAQQPGRSRKGKGKGKGKRHGGGHGNG